MSYHIRLSKALSYSGMVKATKKNPDVFVEDKATAEAAVATGYFTLVEEAEVVTKKGKAKVSDKTEAESNSPTMIELQEEK